MRLTNLIIILMVLLIGAQYSFSQIIAPTGISTRASSQLVYYYDLFESDSAIQLTNSNDTTSVWVHVQIFRSYDIDGAGPTPPVFCDERNFVDFLTPNDTHVYSLDSDNFYKNIGEDEVTPGEETSILHDEPAETKGFVVITPVVSEADLSAISFQHLFGTAFDDSNTGWRVNAVGRDAVDFSTGKIVPDGTPLDGSTNGFVVLQPEELLFNFAGGTTPGFDVDVIGIAFADNYGPAGLLGYQVTPAIANWTSFIFDFKEDPTSCGNKIVNCFYTSGLNDNFPENNNIFTSGGEDALLCSGSETPQYADGDVDANFDNEFDFFGWTRIFVSGLGDFDNHIGYFHNAVSDIEGIDFMYVRGDRTEPEPEPMDEICDDEAMADEDEDGFANCLDTDCEAAENCENGTDECTDGEDNDGDGDTDCADLGCDGTVIDSESGAVCETGGETSCNDGFDNDGDGLIDGDDSDCMVADTGGDDGDGGGCVVTGHASASTTVANILVLMLPFIGVFGIRRFRKRS